MDYYLNHTKRSGFTIVELLIVVVIIAILAAISIVAYTGIQNRARASQASSALSQARKQLEVYKVDNGSYPITGNLASAGVTDTNLQYTSDGTIFCLTATAVTVSYKVSNTTNPEQGGCAGHGQGGEAPITNLAVNPSAEGSGGWYSNNGAQYPAARTTAVSRSGTQSVEAHNLSSHTLLLSLYGPGAANTQGFTVQPSTTYTISYYFRSGVPHQGRVLCTFRLSDGSYTTPDYGSYVQGNVDQWTRASHTCTSPAAATMIRGGAHVYALTNQPANTSAYADDFMVTEGSSLHTYADGSSGDWIWNGTAHASTSTGPAL